MSHDLPINSENPPTGSRHVPVTNCSRRTLFSLSNSRMHWREERGRRGGRRKGGWEEYEWEREGHKEKEGVRDGGRGRNGSQWVGTRGGGRE